MSKPCPMTLRFSSRNLLSALIVLIPDVVLWWTVLAKIAPEDDVLADITEDVLHGGRGDLERLRDPRPSGVCKPVNQPYFMLGLH